MNPNEKTIHDDFLRGWEGPRYLRGGAQRRDVLCVLRQLAAISKTNASLAAGLGACADEESHRFLAVSSARGETDSTPETARARWRGPRMTVVLLALLVCIYNVFVLDVIFFEGTRDEVIIDSAIALLIAEAVVAVVLLVRWAMNRRAGESALTSDLVPVLPTVALGKKPSPRAHRRSRMFAPALLPFTRASVFLALRARLNEGQTLSEAMAGMWRFFPGHYAGRMLAAEQSGRVTECLGELADESAARVRVGSSTAGRRAYGCVLLPIQLFLVWFISVKILPVFVAIFKEFGSTIPASTRRLIAANDFLAYNWPAVITVVCLSVIIVVGAYRLVPGVRLAAGHVLLRVPLWGRAYRYRNAALAARVLGETLGAGTPVPLALAVAAKSGVLAPYSALFLRWKAAADNGASLSQCAVGGRFAILPPGFGALAALGEQADCVDEALHHAAEQYDALADRAEHTARTMYFPVVLAPFVLVTYFIATGVYEAIFGLSDAIFYAL